MKADFDPQDLEALRQLRCGDDQLNGKASRRQCAGPKVSRPTVQLNVRVRPDIKAKAQNLSDRSDGTIADVIERAIGELFVREGTP